MDLNEIKSIIKTDGGKFIIVENDKPSLVVLSFEDYQQHLEKTDANQSPSLFKGADKDSDEEKVEDLSSVAPAEAEEEKKDNELTIDDLPL